MRNLIDNHLTAISDAVNGLTKEVHNRALEYVLEKITNRVEQIERLLDNGEAIIATASGDRWRKIYDKRHELYVKKWELYDVQRIIFDIYIK
mgnify:CR=1 FL=1